MTPQDRIELQEILGVAAPVLGQLINKAMLEALRQHSSEQIATAVQGQELKFAEAIPIYKQNGEVSGEREVWAQAYASANGVLWSEADFDAKHKMSLEAADRAVKAFRERYK